MATILSKAITEILVGTTGKWRRIDARAIDQATEDAISTLSANGLIEERIVVAVEMGKDKMPHCRYVGGGEWWNLLEPELDRLVPVTWIGRDGKPKRNLVKRGNVVAIRLTGDGVDYIQALKDGKAPAWWRGRPKKVDTYLRCDGIESTAERQPVWSQPDTPQRWARMFGVSVDTIKRRFKDGSIPSQKLSDRSYQVDVAYIPERHPGTAQVSRSKQK